MTVTLFASAVECVGVLALDRFPAGRDNAGGLLV